MVGKGDNTEASKISQEFSARLAQLEPGRQIRAIVMVNVKPQEKDSSRRMTREQRKAAIEAIRSSSQDSLVEIDEILSRFGGSRLAPRVNALGSITVETTPRGIEALATSAEVKAILEDQGISPLPKPKR